MSDSTFESSAADSPNRVPIFDARPVQTKTAHELLEYHIEHSIRIPEPPGAAQLLLSIYGHWLTNSLEVRAAGILEVLPDGFGFLRHPTKDFVANISDLYLSPSQITRFGLRTGDLVYGSVRAARGSESNMAVLKILELENQRARTRTPRLKFDDLEVSPPHRPLALGSSSDDDGVRLLDERSAICLGNRLLIAGPPASGTTSWLLRLAREVAATPELTCIGLLADVRPEEAQMFRGIAGAWCSAADAGARSEHQCRAVRLGFERARRLVEGGEDVVVFLDSIGAYARALAATGPRNAVQARIAAKNLFASARETSGASGSLTIVASLRLDSDDGALLRELRRTADFCIMTDQDLDARSA